MANSVVKVTDVTDDVINDSLLLLVDEDGTVTPDRRTVENYLNSKSGPTNLQIMHIDKTDSKGIDVIVDNVTYMPDNMEVLNEEDVLAKGSSNFMDEVARNLYNFRLDHDYTPLTSPKRSPQPEEDDELAKTLSILHGSEETAEKEGNATTAANSLKIVKNINIISAITIPPSSSGQDTSSTNKKTNIDESTIGLKGKSKMLQIPQKIFKIKPSPVANKTPNKVLNRKEVLSESEGEDDSENDEDEEFEDEKDFENELDDDDDNDSDFDIQEELTGKKGRKNVRQYKVVGKRTNRISESSNVTPKSTKIMKRGKEIRLENEKETELTKTKSETKIDKVNKKVIEKQLDPELKISDTKSEEIKSSEKKHLKKKKEPPKPIPGDFALFSTPDIIRKVGGKEPTTPVTPDVPPIQKTPKGPNDQSKLGNKSDTAAKPAKITQESRSKSTNEISHPITPKHNRHSLDSKEKNDKHIQKVSVDSKTKERRDSVDKVKQSKGLEDKSNKSEQNRERKNSETNYERRLSTNSLERRLSESNLENKNVDVIKHPKSDQTLEKNDKINQLSRDISQTMQNSESIPSAEDIRAIIMNEDTKTYTTNTVNIPEYPIVTNNSDVNTLTLDGTGLDLDQTILDNLNNDIMSEDILYQVAQQLVSNTELQNAIDKGINEGVLDTSGLQDTMNISHISDSDNSFAESSKSDIIREGTQIVRPDGRVVVLPPIERPTTRSRNKKKEEGRPSFKEPQLDIRNKIRTVHKPLDEEHVSGNELDSSDENEEESEDDPNKLWCICNQPHNNRFMICCDTCEEWYHGKCVNITKAMGQQMEAEGKEWICLFCKDPALKRPLAAARRIRKASRNSRASSDSNSSVKRVEKDKIASSVPCVVCQKPARKNSIYCSENCILAHAQGIEKVVVFERSTGNMLTGNNAPNASNIDQWLKEHPGYEVVKSAGKLVTTKVKSGGNLTQSKLKLIKNPNNEGVSLAVQQKGVNIGVLKHIPKHPPQANQQAQVQKMVKVIKIYQKDPNIKESKIKLIQPQPMPQPVKTVQQVTPNKPKLTIQTTLTPKGPPTPIIKTPKKEIIKDLKVKTPKIKPKEDAQTPQPKREDIRENVQKTIAEQLAVRLKESDIKLTEEEIKNISIEIEAELYKCFGDTGQKYKNKYRSLIFNIKDSKNQTLWRRICEKSISSYELVRLSPDDMASQELAKWREQEAKHQLDMIKKNEIELLNCNRQYVLKTHKGEEVLEECRQNNKNDNTEIIKSLTEGSTLNIGEEEKRQNSKDKDKDRDKKGSSKHSHKDKNRDKDRRASKERKDRSRCSPSRDKERSSKRLRSRDRSRHDKKKDKRSRSKSRDREKSRERDRHRKSHKSSRHKKGGLISSTDTLDKRSKEILEQLDKIAPPLEERLWKHVPQEDILPGNAPADSDSDHEIPSSTVMIPTPPRSQESDEFHGVSQSSTDSKGSSRAKDIQIVEERVLSPPPKKSPAQIWIGTINMVDVAQISITAHEVSGDCSGLEKELSENLDIVGRISPDTVWDYIGKMRCSNSKIISLIRLTATNIEEQMPYLALYSYLSSRNRLGVVRSTNKAIKDFYILPLASQKPIPQALLPINGPGFEESRPALLLGIVVRDKRKRLFGDSTPSTAPPHHKKTRIEVTVIQTQPGRSYTPPPMPPEVTPTPAPPLPPLPPKVDPRLAKLAPPLPSLVSDVIGSSPLQDTDLSSIISTKAPSISEDDEPYSPEDSDPDTVMTEVTTIPGLTLTVSNITALSLSETTESTTQGYSSIPGLGETLPSTKLDIQRQMEELNKKIELQKSEITSITKNIATSGSEIAGSALASIALPSNLQQILDSIKTIGVIISTEGTDFVEKEPPVPGTQTDLTIPLMIPKTFSRPLSSSPMPDLNTDTIPLNLPIKPKLKPPVTSPMHTSSKEKPTSVLSTLTEEDLIKKAEEMLNEDNSGKSSKNDGASPAKSTSAKKQRIDVSLPPVPGVDE